MSSRLFDFEFMELSECTILGENEICGRSEITGRMERRSVY